MGTKPQHAERLPGKFDRNTSKDGHQSKRPKNPRLRKGLAKTDREYKEAVRSAERTEMLLQEEAGFLEAEGMEKTYKFRQQDIQEAVDVSTANKKFELKLDEFGPYTMDYSRNGRELLIGGRKGHVAALDWRKGSLDTELHLNETVHAVKFLHNDQYFAVAQKKYTFIYDKSGLELHRLKQHIEATLLDFLPYHFLLATAGHTGFLKYHDVSTGQLVSEHRTKLGPTQAMKQNPWNAVMHLGHGNGTVSLWAPSMSTPLAKLLSARGPIRDLAVDREGKYMAVSGSDKTIKLWDLRKMQIMDTYYSPTPASSLDFSDTGLLSVGWGSHVTVWKDIFKTKQKDPYMNHLIPGSKIEKVRHVPFEDVLGVGHQNGFSSLIVPGAGEANYDALELNPYESAKQRQQSEVRSLMNKLPFDTITMDPTIIGKVDRRAMAIRLKPGEINELEVVTGDEKLQPRPDVLSKNSKLRSHLRRKKQNVIDERKMRVERNLKMEKEARERMKMEEQGIYEEEDVLDQALNRFK
ncbi:component of small subunit processosome [Suhomyces tanzawaensis NRRL Y-17324]|uniref:U three protein 7 n=1 Tax=Suhomyces tanzawaensis NRRL Y-17324 TaxID=984487 RepID=A0A1E4SID8_9ASCO|nr:component of small subunit processosome [Suhomyces tanzawaensis NRRL Y-17324]ODV79192.1 component of small subunit processosome [Suhomyces tanzawaensis NRRL Y-17324]